MNRSRAFAVACTLACLTLVLVGMSQADALHNSSPDPRQDGGDFCHRHPTNTKCNAAPGPTQNPAPPPSSTPTSSPTPTKTATPSQTPTPTPTPTPSPTKTPTSSPTSTAPAGWKCTSSAPSGNCGAYYSPTKIVNSNGFNTYVANNCWGDPGCSQTVSANGPDDWQVVANEPRGNTAVRTYPDVQQLFNNWCGNGQWNGCANPTDTPFSALSSLKFGYSLSMPPASSGTIAQAAYDIWTSDPTHNEVMIWVDNDNRGNGGATFDAEYTTADGQQWTLYHYGDEIIWSLGARGTYAQKTSMTDVPVAELMSYLVDHGYEQAGATIGELDFGWEICSSGGAPQTFTISDYSITRR